MTCHHLSKIGIPDGMWRCERCGATFRPFKRGILISWKEAE